ncbi:hypothetical protein HDV06_001454 [Boothiomyces sp. JEL0866]|nr:hypothetical protein HDV06_001454 [Boothiomyces sp. JEL0866]
MQKLQEIIKSGDFNDFTARTALTNTWGNAPGYTFVNDPGIAIQSKSWKDLQIYLESGELKKLQFEQRVKVESFLLIVLYIAFHTCTSPLITSMVNNYDVDNSSIKAIWNSAFTLLNLQVRPSLLSTKEWTLGVAEELEKIRHMSLKEKGFYNSASSIKKPELATILSSSYFSILEFQDILPDIVHLNIGFFSLYSNALPLSWYTDNFMNVITKYLKAALTEKQYDQENLSKIVTIIRSHSSLDNSSPQLQIVGLLRDLVNREGSENILADSFAALISYSCIDGLICTSSHVSLKISQALITTSGELFIKISHSLLQSTKHLDISELLRILQIYYHVTETKAQNYDLLQKGVTIGKCLSYYASGAWMDENTPPQFVLDMQAGTTGSSESSAFALVGVIRALQNRREKHLKSSHRQLRIAEGELILKLDKLDNADYTVLLFGEVMAKSQLDLAELRKEIDLAAFADSCIRSITRSENFLLLNDNTFRDLGDVNSLNIQQLFAFFDSKTKPDSVFFSTLGRASKAIALVIDVLLKEGKYSQVESLFDNLKSFSSSLSISWQDSAFSSVEPNKVLFSYLVIIDPFANHIKKRYLKLNDIQPSVVLPMVRSILVALQSLNFIITRFGSGGLPQFESIYAVLIATILKISTLPEFSSQNRYTLDLLLENISSVEINSNPTLLARQSFYLQTCGKFIDFIGDEYIEKILEFAKPRLIPLSSPKNSAILTENEISLLDLTESAHSVCLDLFATSTLHQKIVREFTIPYIELLLSNLRVLDVDLVKESFKRVVRGLCDFSGIYDHPIQKKRSLLVFEDESFKFNIIDEPDYEFKAHVDDLDHELWAKEATELAWKAVLLLVDFIVVPSKVLPLKQDTNHLKGSVEDMLHFNKEMIDSSNQIRLLNVLFEQISTVSLSKLPELLSLIRKLMLYGPKMEGEFEGFGISMDGSNSIIWTALFDPISDHSRVDYTRRYDIVVWYLSLYKEAMAIRPKLKKNLNVENEIKARL